MGRHMGVDTSKAVAHTDVDAGCVNINANCVSAVLHLLNVPCKPPADGGGIAEAAYTGLHVVPNVCNARLGPTGSKLLIVSGFPVLTR